MDKIFKKIKSLDFNRLIYHEQKIGGLAVTGEKLALTYLAAKEIKGIESVEPVFQKEINLPSGAVENGLLKNKELFVGALKQLVSGQKIPSELVVVSLPPNIAQIFDLEFFVSLKPEDLEKAVLLQASSSLPLDEGEAYFDWQAFEGGSPERKKVILAAGAKKFIEPFLSAVREAGITPVACETFGWSLAREIDFQNEPTLAVILEPDQAVFLAFLNNTLIFQFDVPKPVLFERPAAPVKSEGKEKTKRAVAKEEGGDFAGVVAKIADYAGKISDFLRAENKYDFKLKSVLLVKNPAEDKAFYDSLKEKIKAKDDNLSVTIFEAPLPRLFSKGVARRGLLPRGKDVFVSLMPVGTEESYEQERLVFFIDFMRTLAISLLGFFVVLYAAAFLIISAISNATGESLAKQQINLPSDFNQVKNAAAVFNGQIDKLLGISQSAPKWEKLFIELDKVINQGLAIKNLEVSAGQLPVQVSLSGTARTRENLIQFKDALEKSEVFTPVAIPLSALVGKENIDFSVKLQLKNSEIIYDK